MFDITECEPINVSIFSGVLSFVIASAMLIIIKPNIITKVNDDYKTVVNWPRLLLVSIILGLTASVCVFLAVSKDVFEYNGVRMRFEPVGKIGITY